MTWMRFLKKGCAKLYVRCANNTVTSEPGFDRVSYFTILVTTSYVPLSFLPLDAICNAIEIDLLQMNDEAEIPAKILPDRHYQLT